MTKPWHLPWTASCLCGQVRMEITQPPISSSACHCIGCQKLTGGAYSLTLIIPTPGFRVTQGETVLGGKLGPEKQHYCPSCKSWLFNEPSFAPQIINVRATMLDDASWFTPFVEMFTDEKLPGVVTGAQRSFERYPPEAQWPGLAADFARFGARPDHA
jgi:hypothetical protein